ncbi:hypothetical protein D3C77_586570 [compost metagenome]
MFHSRYMFAMVMRNYCLDLVEVKSNMTSVKLLLNEMHNEIFSVCFEKSRRSVDSVNVLFYHSILNVVTL